MLSGGTVDRAAAGRPGPIGTRLRWKPEKPRAGESSFCEQKEAKKLYPFAPHAAARAAQEHYKNFIKIPSFSSNQLVIKQRMKPIPPSLNAQLAALRTSVPTGPVEGYWLCNSIIEMIYACLTRLFAQLEAMVQLWQAGALPIPAPRTPASRDPAIPAPARHPRRTRHPAAQAAPAIVDAIPMPLVRTRPALCGAPVRAAPLPPGPRARIRATHDPPPPDPPSHESPKYSDSCWRSGVLY